MYPQEIKGIYKIERKGNELTIITATPTRGHKKERYVRIPEEYEEKELKDLVKYLQQFEASTIKDKVKQMFDKSIRQLRKELANNQLVYGVTQASRSLGHNSRKNIAYYVDYLKISEDQGVDEALRLINQTEDKKLFSLIRLAVRIELEIYNQSNTQETLKAISETIKDFLNSHKV